MYDYYDDDDYYSDEPVWFSFIVSEDLNTWAAIATYAEDFSELTLMTSNLDYCMLTPDADF